MNPANDTFLVVKPPTFPEFQSLDLDHKEHIEEFLHTLPPYSDFNFTSLLSWGDCETKLSKLNDNLVVKFKDYITDEPFYTFIGTNKVHRTIEELLEHSVEKNLFPKLKLIPEITLKRCPEVRDKFNVEEDRDNFDYIYLLEESKEFKGKKHRAKRNFLNRFRKLYHYSHKIVDLNNPQIQKEIFDLFEIWQDQKGADKTDTQNELTAIKKLCKFSKALNMIAVGLYIENRLVGFSINEPLPNGFAMNLFEKADTSFEGIFPYLRHIAAIYLSQMDCVFLSHEQDLGIEGLRKSKLSYHPKFFLKKYTISAKNN